MSIVSKSEAYFILQRIHGPDFMELSARCDLDGLDLLLISLDHQEGIDAFGGYLFCY